ncbi:MAG: hypothetical protein O7G85_14015 [Planctomycetota bacterium]|nr:hypothetical protein [Planctomycetota bacterium]
MIAFTGLGLTTHETRADSRRFTYTYETTTMPKGHWEYEQWVTWKTDKDTDRDFDRLDFRHEIEWGVTDNLQAAFYVADWRYQDGKSVEDNGAEIRNSAVELIYSLADPTTDPLGVALYGEVKLGNEIIALEAKLLLQKNIGKWVFAWNGIFEAEWEGERYDEDKGELGQTFGASYQFSPSVLGGFELLHEIEYDDWSEWQDHVIYGGPNFSYRSKGPWWITITAMWQLTDVESEVNFQTRFIMGWDF